MTEAPMEHDLVDNATANGEVVENAAPKIRRWGPGDLETGPEPVVLRLDGEAVGDVGDAVVALATGGETVARACLEKGATKVLFADAAVIDTTLVHRMVGQFGSERIGIWTPARRMAVSWSLDTGSNADFRCLTPSIGKPSWEIVRANGARTGVDVNWWIRQMLAHGASEALVSVDYSDRHDHLVAADLVEEFGDRIWLSPYAQSPAEWQADDWREFGKAGQFVLPPENAVEIEVS